MTVSTYIRMGLVMVAGVAVSGAAQAETARVRDPLVEGAMQCTKFFPRYERQYGIPTHLLSAIASTESGRYDKKLKIVLPWPWTVASGGKGQYFDTKEEAVAAVKKMRANGIKNIDVGCMQVNLHHHSGAFANIEQAFEPEYNVAYSATFLRNLYNGNHSWKQAASDYHSKTPALGKKYIGMVYNSWFNIIEKLREARLTVPSSSLTAMNDMKRSKAVKSLPTAKVEPYPVAAAKPVYAPPRMNSIKVTTVQNAQKAPDSMSYTRRSRDNGVLVVRTDTVSMAASQPQVAPAAAKTVTLADNSYITPAPAAVVAAAPVVAVAAPVEAVAFTPSASRATAVVSVPLSGVTQAAVAPVTGLANAVLKEAVTATSQELSGTKVADLATPSTGFSEHRSMAATPVAYRSGPNFIFSE